MIHFKWFLLFDWYDVLSYNIIMILTLLMYAVVVLCMFQCFLYSPLSVLGEKYVFIAVYIFVVEYCFVKLSSRIWFVII